MAHFLSILRLRLKLFFRYMSIGIVHQFFLGKVFGNFKAIFEYCVNAQTSSIIKKLADDVGCTIDYSAGKL